MRLEGTYYTFPYFAAASHIVIRSSQCTQHHGNLLRSHSI